MPTEHPATCSGSPARTANLGLIPPPTVSPNQDQTTAIFDELWHDGDAYETEMLLQAETLRCWSDNRIESWLSDIWLADNADGRPLLSVLDCGVGLGVGAAALGAVRFRDSSSGGELTSLTQNKLNYTGIDLIRLDKTQEFLNRHCPKWNLSLKCLDMNVAALLPEKFDLVFAMGTLHHTDSVDLALESTWEAVKPGGTYIAWIINEQKPLRAVTDAFFRSKLNEGGDLSIDDPSLSDLAYLFYQLGSKIGDITVDINRSIDTLGIEVGTYKIQTLFYDYFLKCYFNRDLSIERARHQLFDWFAPKNYHQTSRRQLQAQIGGLSDVLWHEIITKTNGHFFALKKAN